MGRNSRLDMQGEDDPLMLDEYGNEISKEEMKELEKTKEEIEAKPDKWVVDEPERKVDDKVSSGFGNKRKAVKVVGDEKVEGEEEDESKVTESLQKSTKDLKSVVSEGKEKAKKDTDAKKKRKKVKLSFDEPD